MTSTQIAQIQMLLGYNTEASNNRMHCGVLLSNYYVLVTKEEMLYTDVTRWRYEFDDNHNILKRYQVRVYSYDASNVPDHGNYDSYSDKDHEVVIYEYLTDSDGHILTDYYDYEQILMFVPNAYYLQSDDVLGG